MSLQLQFHFLRFNVLLGQNEIVRVWKTGKYILRLDKSNKFLV